MQCAEGRNNKKKKGNTKAKTISHYNIIFSSKRQYRKKNVVWSCRFVFSLLFSFFSLSFFLARLLSYFVFIIIIFDFFVVGVSSSLPSSSSSLSHSTSKSIDSGLSQRSVLLHTRFYSLVIFPQQAVPSSCADDRTLHHLLLMKARPEQELHNSRLQVTQRLASDLFLIFYRDKKEIASCKD